MKFSIKQIAQQAGVSKATVDRALHSRGAVHAQTQRRIEQAIKDLETQQRNALASGRTITVDVIMHTPARFSQMVTDALLAEMGNFAPFRIALRLHIFQEIDVKEIKKLLLRCASDSYGIVLKALDSPELKQVIDLLHQQRVPVITLVSDQYQSERFRYIGIENRSAGSTAAYMMARWLKDENVSIAAVIGAENFHGEEERVVGFCETLSRMAPRLETVRLYGGYGIDAMTYNVVKNALKNNPALNAVYSVGGANNAILRAFSDMNRPVKMFIGHDLDSDNRILLEQGKLDLIIQHDLRQDARNIFKSILEYHAFIPAVNPDLPVVFSSVSVVTPFNMSPAS